ncbi:MAG: T9SS type A sorting domain-containing protein, partial [Bacteroidales bacterium]
MKTLFSILFSVVTLLSFAQFSFDFVIESEEDILINSGIEDGYGNYFLSGSIGDHYTNKYDALLVKIFPDGSYFTKRFLNDKISSRFKELMLINNCKFLAIGSFGLDSNNWYTNYFWDCEIDTGLNVISENSFRIDYLSSSIEPLYTLIDYQENVIVAGQAYYYPNPQSDLFFARLNQQGDSLLVKVHQIPSGQSVRGMAENTNGSGYSFVGKGLGYFSITHYSTTDSVFNIITTTDFETELGLPSLGPWLTDSTFLCSGTDGYDNEDKNDEYIHVMIVDTLGVIHKELALDKPGIDDYSAWKYSNAYVNDTTIYLGGFTNPGMWVTYPNLIELYLIDANLNLLGYKEFSGNEHYNLMGIEPTSDGGCLLYAWVYNNPNSYQERDLRVIKVLRSDINLITTVETIQPKELSAEVYPNPAEFELSISIELLKHYKEIILQIYSTSGKKITDRKLTGVGNVIKINVSNLLSGTYFFK